MAESGEKFPFQWIVAGDNRLWYPTSWWLLAVAKPAGRFPLSYFFRMGDPMRVTMCLFTVVFVGLLAGTAAADEVKVSHCYQGDRVAAIKAEVVRRCDDFEWSLGIDPELRHKRCDHGGDVALMEVTHAYAWAEIITGQHKSKVFEVLERYEIDATKARSKASASGPWVTDFDAMARKTAIHRLMKYLPKSSLGARAEGLAMMEEAGHRQQLGDNLIELGTAEVVTVPAVQPPSNGDPAKSDLDAIAGKGEVEPGGQADSPTVSRRATITSPRGKGSK